MLLYVKYYDQPHVFYLTASLPSTKKKDRSNIRTMTRYLFHNPTGRETCKGNEAQGGVSEVKGHGCFKSGK